MSQNCQKLVDEQKKSKHRSKWLKDGIKQLENKEDKTKEERLKLCQLYSVLTSIPLSGDNPIYEVCKGCEFERIFCYGE